MGSRPTGGRVGKYAAILRDRIIELRKDVKK